MSNSRHNKAKATERQPPLPALELEAKNDPLDELRESLELERFRDDVENNLEACCCPGAVTDRRLVILAAQIGFSTLIVLFTFVKLYTTGEDDKVYITLLSSVFSYWTGRSTSSDAKG